MDIPFRRLKKSIAALLVGVLVANCSSVNDYQPTEYEKYCLPLYYLSGSSSAYERIFIRDYPNKRDFTYTSDIGDTIISKGLVTHTKKTLITLKSEDVIYTDNVKIDGDMKSLFNDNELARMYQKSFTPNCESSQAQFSQFTFDNFDIIDKTRDLFLDRKTPSWKSFSKFEMKGNIMSKAYSNSQGILYKFTTEQSSRSFRSTSSDESWQKKTYSIPTAVFVPKDADGYYFLARVPENYEGGGLNTKNMLPVRGSVEIIKEEDIYTPNQNSDNLFNQYLIYNGRSGDSVKFLYREFMGDMNRASFQQEVSYDLKIGEVIGFKGARFKIIEANNVQLKYQVIEAF